MSRAHRPLATTLAAFAAITLGGCSSDPEPQGETPAETVEVEAKDPEEAAEAAEEAREAEAEAAEEAREAEEARAAEAAEAAEEAAEAGEPAPAPAPVAAAPAPAAPAPRPTAPAAARPQQPPASRGSGKIVVGGPRGMSGALAESVPINITAGDADLHALVDAISRQVGRRLSVDPGVRDRVTVEIVNMPWRRALDSVARLARCAVEVRGEALVITRPVRVTLEAADQPVGALLTQIAQRAGNPMKLEVEAGLSEPLSVKFVDRPWRAALDEVARRSGLRLEEKAGALVVNAVRTPARVVTHDGSSLGVRTEDGRVVTLRVPDGPPRSAAAAHGDTLRAAIEPLAFDDAVVVRWGEVEGALVLRELTKP